MFKNYIVKDEAGDTQYISTFQGADKVEHIVSGKVAYTSVHGPNASIGSEWEFAIEGEDEYSPCVAQIWVPTLEGVGDIFNEADYVSVIRD